MRHIIRCPSWSILRNTINLVRNHNRRINDAFSIDCGCRIVGHTHCSTSRQDLAIETIGHLFIVTYCNSNVSHLIYVWLYVRQFCCCLLDCSVTVRLAALSLSLPLILTMEDKTPYYSDFNLGNRKFQYFFVIFKLLLHS